MTGLIRDRVIPQQGIASAVAGMAVRPERTRWARAVLAACGMAVLALPGCSIKRLAINRLGDALAGSGTTYTSDDDPQLVRDALPFALKLIESLLQESPRHPGLLLAATSGFTQYAYAFVQQEADETEDRDVQAAAALRERARRLYLRARDYGLRGLEAGHARFGARLNADRVAALGDVAHEEVPLLYWTAAAWGSAIGTRKDDPDLLADLPLVEALVRRAFELEPDFDHGAIHEFLIAYEGGRSEAMGGSSASARLHFEAAMRLSEGKRAQPLVSLAETVDVRLQNRREFETLLKRALAIDPDTRPEWRLANLVAQRRARWLLSRADLLFAD
jgi:predicted anti-sigma-YlaC factor YlaD